MLSRILGATCGQDRANIFASPPTSLTITEQIFWYIGWHVYRAHFISYSRVFAYLRISVSTDAGTLALGD
jgi:hypothetical protein